MEQIVNTLHEFSVPPSETLTVCEIDGQVQSAAFEHIDVSSITKSIDRYPKVHLTRDVLQTAKSMDEGRDLFLPVDVPFLKHLTDIYHEQGFTAALKTAANHRHIVLSIGATVILRTIQLIDKINFTLHPGIPQSVSEGVSQYSQVRDWRRSQIRAIAWHPDLAKFAVATVDDSVRIYTCAASTSVIPILKCKQQKNVTSLAWRNNSSSDLAIGCEYGVIVWCVDPLSAVARPSINHATMLSRPNHKNVMSLCWSPKGDVLASVALGDSRILVWDVEMDRISVLKRPGTISNSLLRWSVEDERLFVATTKCVFRVWDCRTWSAERWNLLAGRVQAACWSPDGKILVFSTTEEPIIYALTFINADMVFNTDVKNSANQAVPLYDVSKVEIDGSVVGGIVQSMEWDPKGYHLAVLFKDTNYIAIFRLITSPVLQISPGFIISGRPEETPNVMAFQQKFEFGACLTIGWSSGRLQQFPIVYTDTTSRSPTLKRHHISHVASPGSNLSYRHDEIS